MSSKKKTKVKDDETSAKARREVELRQLFNSSNTSTQTQAAQTLTPTLKTATSNSTKSEKTHSHVYEPVAKAPTELRTVISSSPYRSAKRIEAPTRTEEDRDDRAAWWLGPALILAAVLMLGLGWLHIERSGTMAKPVGHTDSTLEAVQKETQAKIEFYRRQLGHRLNQDRVAVEITNNRSAPAIDVGSTRHVDRSMMNGVPLMQEGYVDQNYGSRTRTDPAPVDRPDARIQYSLQEEQHRNEYDRRVQKQYINEFVENARRDGVKVILDDDANVIKVEPLSSSDLEAGRNTRQPGSALPGIVH